MLKFEHKPSSRDKYEKKTIDDQPQAAGSGLAEHVAPLEATLQIISGQAAITVGEESVAGVPGTWVQMMAKTPHSIKAVTPVVMLLTLHK